LSVDDAPGAGFPQAADERREAQWASPDGRVRAKYERNQNNEYHQGVQFRR